MRNAAAGCVCAAAPAGYSIAEIAARYNLDPRRVRRMLKSLYSAYLRLRGDGKEATK